MKTFIIIAALWTTVSIVVWYVDNFILPLFEMPFVRCKEIIKKHVARTDKCNREIYIEGTGVFMMADVSGKDTETWVQLIAKKSGQRVDWFWMGGRVIVKALGDIKRVHNAIFLTPAPTKTVKYLNYS